VDACLCVYHIYLLRRFQHKPAALIVGAHLCDSYVFATDALLGISTMIATMCIMHKRVHFLRIIYNNEITNQLLAVSCVLVFDFCSFQNYYAHYAVVC